MSSADEAKRRIKNKFFETEEKLPKMVKGPADKAIVMGYKAHGKLQRWREESQVRGKAYVTKKRNQLIGYENKIRKPLGRKPKKKIK